MRSTADHEVWEMRDTIAEKSLSIWLEILSIADRNGGELPVLSNPFSRAVAVKCRTSARRVVLVWNWAIAHQWIVCDPTPRVRSYAKFHKTRGTNEIPIGSPPKQPKQPTQPRRIRSGANAPQIVLPEWLESKLWERFKEHRKRKDKRALPLEAERLGIEKLTLLRAAGNDPKAVIEQSIFSNWQGLFPVERCNVSRMDEARARTQDILKRGIAE